MVALCFERYGGVTMVDESAQLATEHPCSYSLTDASGTAVGTGDATLAPQRDHFSLTPADGVPVRAAYRDVLTMRAADYSIAMTLSSGEFLAISKLGYAYEDVARALVRLRNEQILSDMLMGESVLDTGATGDYTLAQGSAVSSGPCELRVYETGLVVLPDDGDLVRLRFGDLESVATQEYAIVATGRDGTRLTVSGLGTRLDPLAETADEAMDALSLKVQELLVEAAPGADPLDLRRAAAIMPEGRAARRSEIEPISAELWAGLEARLAAGGGHDTYAYLSTLAPAGSVAIGLKRGLMGEMTGDYVWCLAPVLSSDPSKPGNAVVMEAYALGDTPRAYATYVFRLLQRAEYAAGPDAATLDAAWLGGLEQVNRCMIEVNFRREPVYLPDARLTEPDYLRYWFALRRLPALRWLRERFVGRVIHSSPEQWRADLDSLLAFNIGTIDDTARPDQGQPGPDEEGAD